MDESSSSNRRSNRNGQLDDEEHESNNRRRSISGYATRHGSTNKQVLPPPPPEDSHISRKRPRSIPHLTQQQSVRMPRKETDVVDRIWHDIDEEQREKLARRKEEAKRKELPASNARDYLPLTANNLRNFRNEDSTISDFIHRQGMVDKLLGYKMLLGKMENCGTLGYEKMNEEEIKQLSSEWLKNFFPDHEEAENYGTQSQSNQRVGPRTPPSPNESENSFTKRPRKGPMTPPGSPGPTSTLDQAAVNKRELIEQLARNFGISSYKVEETLGNGLDKALEDCSKKLKNELMETFKEQLMSKVEKKAKLYERKDGSEALSDQMELVSDTSLSVDLKIMKKEGTDSSLPYHMVVPPPPIPPPIQPSYSYYPQATPPVYQYTPPPPPPQQPPPYQQNMMCYPPPPQHFIPNAPPPQVQYQVPSQQYVSQPPVSTMVLPPVNVPPPPIGVRIDTPIPSGKIQIDGSGSFKGIISVVQALPPTGIPPPPIQTKVPPPPLPQAPPQQPSTAFPGDCWRPAPSDSWQQQPPAPPVAHVAPAPVISPPSVVNVQSTLFSALGLHKPPPPPPPPVVSATSTNIPIPPPPFASLSVPPPPPPPPSIAGPSPPCPPSLSFAPPTPAVQPSNSIVLSPSASSGYRHRTNQFSQPFSNF